MKLEEFEPKSTRPKKGLDPKADLTLRLSKPDYVKSTTSKAPQVIVKIANNATTGSGVKNTIEYLARTKEKEPLEMEDQDGQIIEGDKESIKEVFDQWAERFEKEPEWKLEAHNKYKEWKNSNPEKEDTEYEGKIPRMKRQVTHMILSGKVKNNDQDSEKLMDSVREVMQKEMSHKGYDYLMVMHRDTENPHVHVLINNYNREKDRPKLRINKPELFTIRQDLANELKSKGIEVEATLKKDRPETLKDITKGIEQVHKTENWFKAKVEKAAGSQDAFKHRQQQLRTIKYIEKKVKDVTLPLSGERKEYLNSLKELRKAMATDDKNDLQAKVNMTISKFERDTKEFKQHLEELKNPQVKEPSRTDKIKRAKVLSKYADNLQKDVQSAIKDIRSNKSVSKEDRKKAISNLKTTNRNLEKMNKEISK